MSERLYLSWFHILAELSLREQMDRRRYRGRQRETRSDVPRLPTEVQLSEGWRESRRRAKSGEKTSLSGTQVESRFIPEPAHARCQTLSRGGKKNCAHSPLLPLSACFRSVFLAPLSPSTTVRGVDEQVATSPFPSPTVLAFPLSLPPY